MSTLPITAPAAVAMPTAATGTSSYLPLSWEGSWGTTWSYNPYGVGAPVFIPGFVLLPLAVQDYPSLTKFIPQLAQHWSVKGHQLTVDIRKGVRWQQGGKVTATDLYDTVLLLGTFSQLWPDLTDVSVMSPSQVVFDVRPTIPMPLAEQALLGTMALPSSEYGQFLVPGLKKDEIAYFNENAADPSAAASMPQLKTLEAVEKKMQKYNPKTMEGDGPFRLTGMTILEAKLAKWNGFYDASKIHVPGITWLGGSTANYIPWSENGESDWTGNYFSSTAISAFLSGQDHHVALAKPLDPYLLQFNDHQYPLNITAVRQALAYVIPRNKMIALAYGKVDPNGIAEPRPDGLTPQVQDEFLTKKQINELNPYPVNLHKAAKLLESVGFHRKGGKWFTAKGKPFTLSFLATSGESDVITAETAAATSLKTFGIPSTVTATPTASIETDQQQGHFQIMFGLVGNLDPLAELDAMLGTGNNGIGGKGSTTPGLGFGPTANVPGLGNVDVATTIDHDATFVGPGPEMKKLTWDFARLVNEQVPYLQYGTKQYQNIYSTAKFVKWPPKGSNYWNLMTYNVPAGFIFAIEHGYLRPRKR